MGARDTCALPVDPGVAGSLAEERILAHAGSRGVEYLFRTDGAGVTWRGGLLLRDSLWRLSRWHDLT